MGQKINHKISKRSFLKALCGATAGLACANSVIQGNTSGIASTAEDLWKWSKESMFFINTPRGIKCTLCPNECILNPGDTSYCRNRVNFRGKLYSIAYGNPCSIHVDPIEKKPLYHFYPGSRSFSIATAGCNFACLNCQNWSISQTSPKKTRNYDLMPAAVVEQALNNNCSSIAYTYSEPITFYEYVYDSALIARQKGIKNIIVSNGYIQDQPLRKLCRVLDGANIDLKSFDNDTYVRLTAGSLQPVLNTLKTIMDEGVWLEISCLIVPEWSDSMEVIKKMCNWLCENGFQHTPIHFLRFQPMYKLNRLAPTPVATIQKAGEIAKQAGLKFIYLGNLPGMDTLTICPDCRKLVVERKGYTVVTNNLMKDKCRFCGQKIPGVWV